MSLKNTISVTLSSNFALRISDSISFNISGAEELPIFISMAIKHALSTDVAV